MHVNSLSAYNEEIKKLNGLKLRIYQDIVKNGEGTDRQIAARMGFPHRSHVQPRISDLIRDGILNEIAVTNDIESGKDVRIVDKIHDQAFSVAIQQNLL